MAQKKGLIYRLTMGKDNLPDFTPDRLPGTRFQLFKDVFFNRIGALVKINLLVLLFCLPAIAWVVLMQFIKQADGSLLPYSGNVGIGYPIVNDVVTLGQQRAFQFDLQTYLILIPCIMIASIGLSGAFYVIRRLSWGEGISVASHFFQGIKMNFLPFLWSSLFAGVSLFLVLANIGIYNNMPEIHIAWRIVGIAVSVIQFVLLFSMLVFLTTQAVTYKLKTWALIKNSFLFAIALLPTNLIILILSAIPVVLLMILPTFISVFGYLLFALIGFSYIILLWTVYAHWAYDKFINDKVEGAVKNRGMYKKTEADVKAAEERDRKNKNIRFNNPKKRPKKITSIDEGETFTPLPTSFSRADLMRLEEEKEAVKRSIDAEYEDVEDESDSVPNDTENESAAGVAENATAALAESQSDTPESGADEK